jgi:uncharacterized membrane protein YhaH (DUF805 family)
MDFNWFLDPIQNHYVDFQGVAGRQAFWMYWLFYIVIAFVIGIIAAVTHLYFIFDLYSLALFLPSLGLGARRLHDTGKSAWWLLIGFVPLIGLVLIYFFCQPSTTPYGATA